MLKKVLKRFFPDNWPYILIVIGSVVWSIPLIRSGLKYPFGLGFWGPNAHDGLWHVALIESLAQGSLANPIFSGTQITNYHIGFDLLLAGIHKLTTIPVLTLYFQIFPAIAAVLIGFFSYKFIYRWSKSKAVSLWSLFFIYFGGGFGYVVSLIRGEGLAGDSMFWIQSQATSLINPPYALSLIFILLGLLSLINYVEKEKSGDLVLAVLFFGLLSQIKIYAAVVILGSLFGAAIYQIIASKKYQILKVFLLTGIISVLLLLLISPNSASLVIFYPFWFLEGLMNYGDRLHWEKFFHAMVTYKQGRIFFKAVAAYGVALLLFVLGNFGTRIVGFLTVPRWINRLDWLKVFILSGIVLGLVLPLFFIQQGTPWNTIQFSYYAVYFSAFATGFALQNLDKVKIWFKYPIIFLLLLLTLPTTLATLRHYTSKNPHSRIANAEIQALEFLGKQPAGTVLSLQLFPDPSLKFVSRVTPMPIYVYESTAYVTALTGQREFFADEVNLNILGLNWPERKSKIENFLKDANSPAGRDFLRSENIRYIYLVKRIGVGLDEKTLNLQNIYDNAEVIVYRVI